MTRIIPDPVAATRVLPKKVDVVIVGGGIIGATTALSLAEQGVSVALCEKGLIGAEQSGRNWGWVRQMGRDPAELPLAIESLKCWRNLNKRVQAETGFRQSGIAYLCRNTRQEAAYEAWLVHARACGLDSRLLTKSALADHLPGLSGGFQSALYTATDGRGEPFQATPAIANAAIRAGAQIFTSCAARAIERTGGKISGVITEHGVIACSTVVLAGGAWSRLFAGNMGLDLPQLTVLGTVSCATSVSGVPDMPVGADRFAFRRRLDGNFTISVRNSDMALITPDSFRLFNDFAPSLVKNWSQLRLRINRRFIEEWRTPRHWAPDAVSPFEKVRILDPVPSETFNHKALADITRAFPAFAQSRILQSWGGLIDVTPDAVPVISPVRLFPGLFLATGFSGHGFGIGPGAGKLMAELVMGKTPCVDPAPFRFERFRRTRNAKPAAASA